MNPRGAWEYGWYDLVRTKTPYDFEERRLDEQIAEAERKIEARREAVRAAERIKAKRARLEELLRELAQGN